MNRFSAILALLLVFVLHSLSAQISFPQNAPSDRRQEIFAFTNATIYTDYKTRVEGATLLIEKGKVMAVGTNITLPAGAVVTDCTGKTIYPAFIDLYAGEYGLGR